MPQFWRPAPASEQVHGGGARARVGLAPMDSCALAGWGAEGGEEFDPVRAELRAQAEGGEHGRVPLAGDTEAKAAARCVRQVSVSPGETLNRHRLRPAACVIIPHVTTLIGRVSFGDGGKFQVLSPLIARRRKVAGKEMGGTGRGGGGRCRFLSKKKA